MKASELRIGNLLLFGESPVKVIDIYPSHFNCQRQDGVIIGNNQQNNFTPIPLTEKRLLELGFNKREPAFINTVNPYWVKQSVVLLYVEGQEELGYLPGIGFRHSGQLLFAAFPNNQWIKEVHKLQNLYFDLNSEELETNTKY